MNNQSPQSRDDLFYETLIQSYVNNPHFIERPWLKKRIETAISNPNCRFVLLTAEPGAGKTGFMSWLANLYPDCLRYFIRRDSQIPLSSGDARSFLFTIGYQLAATNPTLFSPDKLEIVVNQRIGEIQQEGKAIGISVQELHVSPFFKTSLLVQQDVKIVAGDLEGISVGKMVSEKRFLELENLQYLSLLDPAQVLLKEEPDAKIVILIDALDELRYYHGKDSILDWLSTCPELPSNVRFVITSRPEDMLNIFKQRQKMWLKEEIIDAKSNDVKKDIRGYITNFVNQELFKQTFDNYKIESNNFVDQAGLKADGNFQYIAALLRGIEQTLEINEKAQLERLLRFENVPNGLENLYSFFLGLLKNSVINKNIEIPGDTLYEEKYVGAWEGLYQPILGSLAVAMEPLDFNQIKSFSGFQGEDRWLSEALGRMGQFLDHIDKNFRFYHATFAEFLISSETQTNNPDFYLDSIVWHRKIIAYYRGKARTWEDVDWKLVDEYGLLHLTSHLYAMKDVKVGNGMAYRQDLYGLICKSFMRGKKYRFGSHQSFASDVDLVTEAAQSEEPPNFVQLIRNVLIYATLGSFAMELPPQVLAMLVHLGHGDKAMSLASLNGDKSSKVISYIYISKEFAKQKDLKKAKNILIQALKISEAIESAKNKAYGLSQIAHAMDQIGERTEACEIADKSLDIAEKIKDDDSFRMIALLMAQLELFDKAISTVEKIDHIQLYYRGRALIEIIQAMAKVGNKAKAEEIANYAMTEAKKWKYEIDKIAEVLSEIALTMNQLGNKDKAEEIANYALTMTEKIKFSDDRIKSLIKIAIVWSQMGNRDKAEEIVNSVEAKWYNELFMVAKAMVQLGNFEQAFTVVEKMKLAASGWNLKYIALVMFQNGDRTKAEDIKAKAEEVEKAIEIEISDLEKKSIDIDERVVAEWLRNVGATFAILGDFEKALAITEKISVDYRLDALYYIAETMAELGDIEKALAIADIINDTYKEEITSTMYRITRVTTQMEELEKLIAAAERIRDSIARDETLSYIKFALDEAGKLEQSMAVWWKIDNIYLKARALSNVRLAVAHVGKAKAEEFVNSVLDEYEKITYKSGNARALSEIALAMFQVGERAKAEEIVNNAFVVAEQIELYRPKAMALGEIALVMARLGDQEKAIHVANKVLATAEKEPFDTHMFLFIGTLFAKLGEFEKAMEVAESIGHLYDMADAIGNIAQAMAKAGKLDKAMEAIEKIGVENIKNDALSDVQAITEAKTETKPVEIGNGNFALPIPHTKTKIIKDLSPKAWVEEFILLRFSDRDEVFAGLTSGIPFIIESDKSGQSLWNIYNEIIEVDSWWNAKNIPS